MAEAADFPGTSASPARQWLRRTGALLTAAPLLAGLLHLPAAAPADAAAQDSPQAAGGSGSVAVSVNSLTPSTPTDDDTVTVSGTVTNRGKQTVTDAQVNLRLGSPLATRSARRSVASTSRSSTG